MEIEKNFSGGNISLIKIENDDVYIEREVRENTGYFYWAFRVRNAENRTLRFIFPAHTRVGRFGVAVSHDLKAWHWSNTKCKVNESEAFTYTFKEGENSVYFAHHMVYSYEMLKDFLEKNNIELKEFTKTKKGRSVPCFTVGEGENLIVVTSRHHACESTGTYILEGFAESALKNPLKNVKFLFVPFVDFDGVMDGDPGKNRLPHDHNRDYGEASVYNETKKLKEIADSGRVLMNFDFHSPHHDGGINDFPYFMKFPNEEIYEGISKNLQILTKNDKNSLLYTGLYDLPYGSQWNKADTPNVKNYFLKRTKLKASLTMETPYFCLEDNVFTQQKAINTGKHLYAAVYKTLEEFL